MSLLIRVPSFLSVMTMLVFVSVLEGEGKQIMDDPQAMNVLFGDVNGGLDGDESRHLSSNFCLSSATTGSTASSSGASSTDLTYTMEPSATAAPPSLWFTLPRVDVAHVALTLRFTCEMNRRLQQQRQEQPEETFLLHHDAGAGSLDDEKEEEQYDTCGHHHSYNDEGLLSRPTYTPTVVTARTTTANHGSSPPSSSGMMMSTRGGVQELMTIQQQQHLPISLAPSSSTTNALPLSSTLTSHSLLTVFHAKTPRRTKQQNKKIRQRRVGISRWGPHMENYIRCLIKLFQIQDNPLVLTVALLYLDRASSVQTMRYPPPHHHSHQSPVSSSMLTALTDTTTATNANSAVPYCTPRTVHRLFVTALFLSCKVILQWSPEEESYYEHRVVQTLGIHLEQLQHMKEWMMYALGVDGFYIPHMELQTFLTMWQQTWQHCDDDHRLLAQEQLSTVSSTATTTATDDDSTSSSSSTPPPPPPLLSHSQQQQQPPPRTTAAFVRHVVAVNHYHDANNHHPTPRSSSSLQPTAFVRHRMNQNTYTIPQTTLQTSDTATSTASALLQQRLTIIANARHHQKQQQNQQARKLSTSQLSPRPPPPPPPQEPSSYYYHHNHTVMTDSALSLWA